MPKAFILKWAQADHLWCDEASYRFGDDRASKTESDPRRAVVCDNPRERVLPLLESASRDPGRPLQRDYGAQRFHSRDAHLDALGSHGDGLHPTVELQRIQSLFLEGRS